MAEVGGTHAGGPVQPATQALHPESKKWVRYGMPTDMTGKSLLDLGCWEANECAEAVMRGASRVVGVDLCTCEALRANVERYGIEFLQLDVMADKFWQLPEFDIVLCSGVLYHVENPLGLLFRLRKVTREALFLETATHLTGGSEPLLRFHPGRELRDDPSNWWTPNEACLRAMLQAAGFEQVEPVFVADRSIPRLGVRAVPSGEASLGKVLPRPAGQMSIMGGERRGHRPQRSGG